MRSRARLRKLRDRPGDEASAIGGGMTTTTDVVVPTAGLIQRELELAERKLHDSLEHYLAAGAMLIEAKRSTPHGGWLPWLERYVGIGEREAQRYMQLAEHRDEIEAANPSHMSDLTLSAALRQIRKPKSPTAAGLLRHPGGGERTTPELRLVESRDGLPAQSSAWSERQHGKRDHALRILRESVQLIESTERLSSPGIAEVLRRAITQGTVALAIVDELASSFES
jgi:hypothetical protein